MIRHAAVVAVLAVLGHTAVNPASASVVVPMTIQTLADHAGQVMVGDVVAVESHWVSKPRRIETTYTLANVEYLKGELPEPGATFALTVPGGSVGDVSMRLAGAPEFAVGQRWILFLLPRYQTFPVVGLDQGAFRVVRDAEGIERIHTAGGLPVTGLSAAGFIEVAGARRDPQPTSLVSATHARVRWDDRMAQVALAYQDFVTLLRPVLDASRQHNLTAPAGQRAEQSRGPAPLRTAEPSSQPGDDSGKRRTKASAVERVKDVDESRGTSQ